MDNPDIVIGEMCRVLNPGGKLFITVIEKTLDLKPANWSGGVDSHVTKFSTESFVASVKRYGLEIEDATWMERKSG
jgi:hypothetical protein